MRATRSFSITLPLEMADMVRSKVSSGEYASESEVIHDGLRSLAARDAHLEKWLAEEVAPTFDAAIAEPSRALSAMDAWAQLERHMNSKLETSGDE